MKHTYLFAALCCALLVACNQNQPQQIQQVTFNINTFEQSQQPLRAPQSTILDDENGTALTDLYIFDGTSQVAHQTNDDPSFGTVTLNLAHGSHSLSFILTRSTGMSYNSGILSMTSIRPTFGKLLALNVNGSTPAQNLTLDRISGMLSITINDQFPATADKIEFAMPTKYNALNVTSLLGVNADAWSQKVSCTSKQGQSGVQYHFNTLCPSLTDEYTSDLTINIYNSSDAVIYTVTIEDVRFAANTKTLISGNLFTAPSASVTVNTSWNSNIVGTW